MRSELSSASVRRVSRVTGARSTATNAPSTLVSMVAGASTNPTTSSVSAPPASSALYVNTTSTSVWHDRVPTAAPVSSSSTTSCVRARLALPVDTARSPSTHAARRLVITTVRVSTVQEPSSAAVHSASSACSARPICYHSSAQDISIHRASSSLVGHPWSPVGPECRRGAAGQWAAAAGKPCRRFSRCCLLRRLDSLFQSSLSPARSPSGYIAVIDVDVSEPPLSPPPNDPSMGLTTSDHTRRLRRSTTKTIDRRRRQRRPMIDLSSLTTTTTAAAERWYDERRTDRGTVVARLVNLIISFPSIIIVTRNFVTEAVVVTVSGTHTDPPALCTGTHKHFYRAMLCIARTMLSQDVCPSVLLSVHLSVRHTPVLRQNG